MQTKKTSYWVIPWLIFCACNRNSGPTELSTTDVGNSFGDPKEETRAMVRELKQLHESGKAEDYYHWNQKLAESLQVRIKEGTPQQQMNTWFEFCRQTLFAGQSEGTIQELSGFFRQKGQPYEDNGAGHRLWPSVIFERQPLL